MSTSRKIVKVFSIISLIAGLIFLVGGILLGVGIYQNPDLLGLSADKAHLEGIYAAVAVGVQGVADLIVGWLGVKAANRPSKAGGYIVISVIALVYQLFFVVYSLVAATGFDTTSCVHAVFDLVMVFLGINIKKEAQR